MRLLICFIILTLSCALTTSCKSMKVINARIYCKSTHCSDQLNAKKISKLSFDSINFIDFMEFIIDAANKECKGCPILLAVDEGNSSNISIQINNLTILQILKRSCALANYILIIEDNWVLITKRAFNNKIIIENKLEEQLKSIVIYSIDWRKASMNDLVEYFSELVSKKGIDCRIKYLPINTASDIPKFSLKGRHITLYDALKIVTILSNTECIMDKDIIELKEIVE